MKKHLYLIRHGVTNHLAQNIQQNDFSELSDHGHAQARAVARRFGLLADSGQAAPRGPHDFAYISDAHTTARKPDFLIQHLATSPYTRAVETADALAAATGLPVQTLAYVHERRVPSSLEGTSIHSTQREEVIEAIYKLWIAGKNERYEDEETYTDIVARVNKLKDYVTTHPAQHIAVVSHATFIKTFLSTVFSDDAADPQPQWSLYKSHEISNTGISEFTYDPEKGWKLVTWNDRSHLFNLVKLEKEVGQE